ncbi:MAG: hypothetical protein HC886_05005 [Leptolyngbyaceae cyanobacterium SM1_1_3]|nr:hypothetical protein [Leptolyngbyaceae cyanobacterium SM1_1_3]
MSLSEQQSQRLEVKNCCLLLSANKAYARAEEDVAVLSGVRVSGSTQQRLVHRQDL